MICPLCGTGIKKNLLLTSLALLTCPDEKCVYPYNLTIEEIQRQKLIVQVTEGDIMHQMSHKLTEAGVDFEINLFIVKSDPEVLSSIDSSTNEANKDSSLL